MMNQQSGRPVQPTIHVIGGVTVDLIMGTVAPWPRPGTETFVNHSELRAGGPAGNTALALRALNVKHRVISNIGNDMFGQWLADTFGETSYGWQRVSSPTSISIGIEHPGGERSFLTAAGNLAEQTAADILGMMPARAQPGDIALLTGAFLYPALLDSFDKVLDLISKRGFAVALDTGWPPDGWDPLTQSRATAWLSHCDHVLLNEIECFSLSGIDSIEAAGRWMVGHAKPGAVVVMKRGAQGASAWAGGETFHVPAPVVEVVDTTGAGDAFNAGYLSARLAGMSVEAALEDGVELASTAIASSPREYRQSASRRARTSSVGAGGNV
jgi:sugar/nucleoside kinase (ribokinase family)